MPYFYSVFAHAKCHFIFALFLTDANGGRIGAGEYTTDRNGQITVTGLTPGMTVIAREVRTVKGYVLNGNPQTITIGTGANNVTSGATGGAKTGAAAGSSGNSMTFYDEPLSVLIVRKFIEGTENELLSGVEFRVTDGKGAAVGKGTYYTDKSGEIRVENLEPGMTVTVREPKPPPVICWTERRRLRKSPPATCWK